MSPKTVNLVIMFADISGSTRLFEVLGDKAARTAVARALESLTKVIRLKKGKVIKTIGDEIMCIFPTADDAASTAIKMQETLENENETHGHDPEIKIRVGMHYGSAIFENEDVFGDAVNVAARMAAQAKGGQIITTKTTVNLLGSMTQEMARFVDRAPIKGKKKDIEIYEILWQEEDATRLSTNLLHQIPKMKRMSLQVNYKGQSVTMNQDRSGIVMGRSQDCDLPINEKLASRQHVRIELRKNKFFIIDQSTNGTHIEMDNKSAFLRREEMLITANGQISLGKAFAKGPTELIEFKLKSP